MQVDKNKKQKSFSNDIYDIVRQIPYGRVSTYGAIAQYLETVTPRMVGWAMNKSGSASPPVPAHRVVNRKGELTGRHFFATPTMMQELLENENITIEQNAVKDFKNLFWDPINEITD